MTKRNGLIALALIAAVALVSAALLLISRSMAPAAGPQSLVVVQVDGTEYGRYLLSEPQTVVVRQETGEENVIEIDGEGVKMLSSTCDNQLCVHMGTVTEDNWEWRPNGAFIICLPNRVSVELIPASELAE